MKILLLEDDTLLAQSVIEELEEEGYEVTWTQESNKAADIAYDEKFDLYLFDVNVLGMSGFELLSALRDSGDATAAIFMTSRNQIEDIRNGFRVGADDYIKKPFDLDELLIRVASKLPHKRVIKLTKEFIVDGESYTLTCKGKQASLAKREFELLNYFIKHSGQLLETHRIVSEFSDSEISIATLRTYIKTLKRHIEGCGAIENVKGVGYRFKLL